MAELIYKLDMKIKYILNFIRVPAFINAVVTRAKSARFCRYSCVSGVIK